MLVNSPRMAGLYREKISLLFLKKTPSDGMAIEMSLYHLTCEWQT